MKRLRYSLFVYLILVLLPCASFGTDRHVGIGQPYASIQSAINASRSGDTIYVHSGTYAEGIDCSGKTGITVTGYSTDSVTLTGRVQSGYGYHSVKLGTGVIVSNLKFAPTLPVHSILFSYQQSNWAVNNCTVLGNSDDTNYWFFFEYSNGWSLTNCSFGGYTSHISTRIISCNGWVVRNNKFDLANVASNTQIILITNFCYKNGTAANYLEGNYYYNIGAISTGYANTAMMFRQTDDCYVRNNVWSYNSDWNGSSYFQIRGSTDGGAGCNRFYLTNNTIFSARTSEVPFIHVADRNNDVKVTNNLIIGNINNFIADLTPSGSGTGNIAEHNRVTDSSVTWLQSGRSWDIMGWTQANNISGQSVVWNNSGDKPNPFFDLKQSLKGGEYSFNPKLDYNQDPRGSVPDIGAFEYGDVSAPRPPIGLIIIKP